LSRRHNNVHLDDRLNSDKYDWQLLFIVSQKITRVTHIIFRPLLQHVRKMSASSTNASA